jgi:hypothetical protein
MTTVTGRTYTSTRPRGFAPWSPRADTLDLLELVGGVLDEYSAQLPLTARQIFYRLVGAHGYDKTEAAYARLCEYLNRARRAGIIAFGAIRDDGTVERPAPGWAGPGQFWRAVRSTAERYVHDLSDGQPYYVELWIEATGMVPQATAVAHRYGVPVYSAGGFNGLTDKYQTARRLAGQSRPAVILHAGDYDPSGCAIIDSLAEDITAFAADLDPAAELEFRRVAVTPSQIRRYQLPTAPQKRTDQRGEHMADTVQAEALPPDVLAAELAAAIEQVTDPAAITAARQLGDSERVQILAVLATVPTGSDDD